MSKKNPPTDKNDDRRSTLEARGKRVESLRRMTCLSRRAFQEKFGISANSLQNWEDVRANGLTEKAAGRLVRALQTVGIQSSVEWLMYGMGSGPQVSEQFYLDGSAQTPSPSLNAAWSEALNENTKNQKQKEENAVIAEELLHFREHHPKSIDMVVQDDGMEPRFIVGECVAGIRRHTKKEIESLVGLDCIVQTSENEMLVRTVKKGNIEGKYTLTCSNQGTTVTKPILYDVEITTAAPVIWARRKDSK